MIVVDTTDREVAAEVLSLSFPGLGLKQSSDGRPFRFVHSREQRGALGYARMRVRGVVETSGAYPEEFAVARRLAGSIVLDYGFGDIDTRVPYLRPPGPSRGRFEDSSAELISVDVASFRRLAARHLEGTGRRLRHPRPDAAGPTAPGALLWQAAADAVASDDGTSALRTSALEDVVVSTMLWAFPMTDAVVAPGAVGMTHRALRRAIDYIDGHLGEPISVADVADAASVSVRTLQAGFAKHLGTSPMRYLSEARMDRAHVELGDSDAESTTVAAIARAWGFTHPSRFAADYRRRFGENPSATLRR